MEYGLFMMPSHPPERSIYDAHQWDLDCLVLADELGYSEAWIGEHFTSPWEPIPSPDIMIAQALMRTKRIKLAPGAHLLPFHHPVELAHRVAYLDHLAQGRFMFGVGASGLPTDWAMFNVDGMNGQHREMTRESLEIILKIWEDTGPFEYKGKFWDVEKPDTMYGTLKFWLTPYQKPHPPIFLSALKRAGVSPEEAAHVGDQYHTDVQGARSMGMMPVLLDRDNWHPEITDCPRVSGLMEVESVIDRAGID